MDNLIAKFKIDDKLYLIFPDGKQKGNQSNQRASHIAGELLINKQRYIIVQSIDEHDKNSSDKPKSPVNILTKRELQIVMLVSEGRVNKQIADQLNISEWTVSTHLRRIFAKLGVDSRAAMVYRCSDLIGQTRGVFKST